MKFRVVLRVTQRDPGITLPDKGALVEGVDLLLLRDVRALVIVADREELRQSRRREGEVVDLILASPSRTAVDREDLVHGILRGIERSIGKDPTVEVEVPLGDDLERGIIDGHGETRDLDSGVRIYCDGATDDLERLKSVEGLILVPPFRHDPPRDAAIRLRVPGEVADPVERPPLPSDRGAEVVAEVSSGGAVGRHRRVLEQATGVPVHTLSRLVEGTAKGRSRGDQSGIIRRRDEEMEEMSAVIVQDRTPDLLLSTTDDGIDDTGAPVRKRLETRWIVGREPDDPVASERRDAPENPGVERENRGVERACEQDLRVGRRSGDAQKRGRREQRRQAAQVDDEN